MPEPRDECRQVTLPSGEVIRVRGSGPLGVEAVAALSDLVDAARALHAAEHPADPGAVELWARVDAARGDRLLRELARQVGVPASVLYRLIQGRMPGESELAAIERWLTEGGTNA